MENEKQSHARHSVSVHLLFSVHLLRCWHEESNKVPWKILCWPKSSSRVFHTTLPTQITLNKGQCHPSSRLPWWRSGKESPTNAGDVGSIPESERSPGEGNGNPLQYPCLEKPMERGAWQATVRGVTESDTT